MITSMIIEQIKDLSRGLSRKELEAKYFEELEKLPARELVIIRDSFIQETETCCYYPDFDNIY
jgi:hypothetical protein